MANNLTGAPMGVFNWLNDTSSDVAEGDLVLMTDTVGRAAVNIPVGEIGAVQVKDVEILVQKTAGTAWTTGQQLYYHVLTAKVNTVSAGGVACGKASRVAASGATTGYLALNLAG